VSFPNVRSAGTSTLDRELYYFTVGRGDKKVFLNGAHHALEWITAPLLVEFANAFNSALSGGGDLYGYDVGEIARKVTYYIMPMVNPDGVDIVLNGITPENPYYTDITEQVGDQEISAVWQANIRGVDLNHNYDALFEAGKRAAENAGIVGPGPTRWPGEEPFSEFETRAVRSLVLDEEFDAAVAFHSQGEVIYWEFNGKGFPEIARSLARVSGYALDTAAGISSYSGFKDWYLEKFDLPAFTVEVGRGTNPIPFEQFESLKEPNFKLILELAEQI